MVHGRPGARWPPAPAAALIGQQGEDLGIKLGLGQLPDAIHEDFIRQGSEPQAGISRQLAAKAELIKKLGAEAGEGLGASVLNGKSGLS